MRKRDGWFERMDKEDGIKRDGRGLCKLLELLRNGRSLNGPGDRGLASLPAGHAHEPSNLNLAKLGH